VQGGIFQGMSIGSNFMRGFQQLRVGLRTRYRLFAPVDRTSLRVVNQCWTRKNISLAQNTAERTGNAQQKLEVTLGKHKTSV
jgi:hypothetical protein